MKNLIKGITVEIGGDTTKLGKALEDVNKRSNSLKSELKGVNTLLKMDPSNITLLKQKQDLLNESIKGCKEKLDTLKDTQSQVQAQFEKGEITVEQYRDFQREIEATEIKLKSLTKEAGNFGSVHSQQMIQAGEEIEKFGGKIEKVGQKFNVISTGIAALGGASIKGAMDWESAFTGVMKTVEESANTSYADLEQGLLELSTECASSAEEIAQVAENAGQLGIQTDSVLSFTKAMIMMGDSTNLTADEASSQLAKFANIMQMSQADFEKLGASIVDLGNNYATTEADIVEMAMRIAGAGKQVGLSEGEVLGLATALSSVGIEAEMGGSAISKAMIKMQNAVELGGGKLSEITKKTGKSIRDLQLLMSNDSEGFTGLANDLEMTKTELKQLINAGAELESFAKISGMTTDQFKKAWGEDAVGALTNFMKSLDSTEAQSDSAIALLTEMGITEVRLRDTLLRAANAGDLFNNAIETGTKAWDENTALTEEAEKRYGTTASQVVQLVNEIKKLGIEIGKQLMPTFKKVLETVRDLAKWFSNLTEEQKETILKIAGVVAAIGPLLTITGKLTTGLGQTVKTTGNFIGAIKNVASGVKDAEGQIGTFTKVLTNLPMAAAAITVGTLTYALLELTNREEEVSEKTQEARKFLDEQKESWENLEQAAQEYIANNSSEITEIQHLRDELSKITDENGKVKDGYVDRANFIINELQQAIGTEISMNDGVIQSYQDVQKAVDDTITKKQAELLLSAYQAKYTDALQNRGEAIQHLANLQDDLTQKLEKQKSIEDKLNNQKIPSSSLLESYNRVSEEIDKLNTDVANANEEVSKYGYTISSYMNLQTAAATGNTEAITAALDQMNTKYEKAKEVIEQSYTEQINSTGKYISTLKTLLQDAMNAGDSYREQEIKNELDTQKTKLKNLEDSFKNEIYTIGTLGPEQVQAFQAIADNNVVGYMNILNNLDPDTQALLDRVTESVLANIELPGEMRKLAERIRQNYKAGTDNIVHDMQNELKATEGVVRNYNGIEIAIGDVGANATTSFDYNNQMSQKMQEEIGNTANMLNADTSVGDAAGGLGGKINTGFKGSVNGWQWGFDLVKNIADGLLNNFSIGKVVKAASGVASAIKGILGHSVPAEGPLKDELTYMPDMVNNLVLTLRKSSPKLKNATMDVAKMMSDNLDFSNLVTNLKFPDLKNIELPSIPNTNAILNKVKMATDNKTEKASNNVPKTAVINMIMNSRQVAQATAPFDNIIQGTDLKLSERGLA